MAKQTSNIGAISQAIIGLDKATHRFAELMMDAAVSSAIRGKTMNEARKEVNESVTAPHSFAPAEFK